MDEASDRQFSTNLINNLMETWILPSIRKRQERGKLEKPLKLVAAQIVFKLDSKPTVRINDEVRGEAKFEAKPGCEVEVGSPVLASQIASLTSFKLPEDERDWGHATIILVEDRWFIFFDFIYNRRKCADHIAAAKEFLAAATDAFEAKRNRVFVDNLASASELAAKAYLLSQPDRAMLKAKSHSLVHSKINVQGKAGNVDGAHVETFNQLQQLRYPARYLNNSLRLEDVDSEGLLETVGEFIEAVESRVQIAL